LETTDSILEIAKLITYWDGEDGEKCIETIISSTFPTMHTAAKVLFFIQPKLNFFFCSNKSLK